MAGPTSTQRRYFKATAPVALPPLLLLTVMVPGFVATLKRPRNRPLPSPVSVPIFAFVDVTKMVRVALAFVLVASTFSCRFELSNSARVRVTESDAGVACGVTVKPTLRVVPPALPRSVATICESTCLVVMLKLLSTNPAEIVVVAGTVVTFGLLLLNCTSTPPAGAPASRLTVPCAVVPPWTEEGETVIAASRPFDNCGKRGCNRTGSGTGNGNPTTTARPFTRFCAVQFAVQTVAAGAISVESSPIT